MSIMINNNFSRLLGEKLLKISKIAKDTGISRTTLTNLYYRRSTFISFDVLDKLCTYLNCQINDIIEYRSWRESSGAALTNCLQSRR